MAEIYVPNTEELGRRRFLDNKAFRKQIFNRSSLILNAFLDLVPSNYSVDFNTNQAQFLKIIAREFARLQSDIQSLNDDKVYTDTRIKFLNQILGERLFLQDRIAPANYNDETYRDYVISIKDAYLKGSRKENIETLASKFTGMVVHLKELYLEARKPDSSYDVHDTHKMIVEVFVEDMIQSGRNLTQLLNDLDFFVNLVRPAHVLYDTNLIWSDTYNTNKVHDLIYGDTGGGCVPVYSCVPMEDRVIMAYTVVVVTDTSKATGRIDSVQDDFFTFFLTDQTRVLTEPGIDGSKIFNEFGKRIPFNGLRIGDYVRLTYVEIPCDFEFYYKNPDLNLDTNARFYRSVYRRPAFQENVIKVMDSKGRFPEQIRTTPTTLCDRWVQDLLDPLYEDMRKNCLASTESDNKYSTTLNENMGSPRLSYPYPVVNPEIQGNEFSLTIPNTPLTDGSGNPATISDLAVQLEGMVAPDSVSAVDASTGFVSLVSGYDYWDSTVGAYPIPGDELNFDYFYSSDGTDTTASSAFVYGIQNWQMPNTPLMKGDSSGTLAEPSDIEVSVDGTVITGAVFESDPLLGHVILNNSSDFWQTSELGRLPAVGDSFDFGYTSGYGQDFSILFDDHARTFDGLENGQSSYGAVFDVGIDGTNSSAGQEAQPVEIGYRYRAYLLHHSSVLNSPDTFVLNGYQKPVNRASLINQQNAVNHKNLFFSGEFLEDGSQVIELNDQYLENGLDPILKLREGVPPFQKTFSYHPRLVYQRKLQDIREHRSPLLYSDLLLKEFRDDGQSVPLSSICDNAGYTFKIMYKETIPPPEECDPWMRFDAIETLTVPLTIPGEMIGVVNLRVTDKHLRENFILREISDVGVASITYSVDTPANSSQTVFYLPEYMPIETPEYGVVEYPALPIMKDESTLADTSDVLVTIDGAPTVGIVKSLDPVSGKIELFDPASYITIDHKILEEFDILSGQVKLTHYPLDPTGVTLRVNGVSKVYGTDYYVLGQYLIWRGSPLDGVLVSGNDLEATYLVDPLINSTVEFTYNILNSQNVQIIDSDRSRLFDSEAVFPGYCPDPIQMETNVYYREYLNFLDDSSQGIKVRYFNKETYQIEEHVFSGPLFEYFDAREDQLSPPESFPNALVRINGPIHSNNPLNYSVDYDFINDQIARFRKKTFKELLPDRTFRTLEVTEMMPI